MISWKKGEIGLKWMNGCASIQAPHLRAHRHDVSAIHHQPPFLARLRNGTLLCIILATVKTMIENQGCGSRGTRHRISAINAGRFAGTTIGKCMREASSETLTTCGAAPRFLGRDAKKRLNRRLSPYSTNPTSHAPSRAPFVAHILES